MKIFVQVFLLLFSLTVVADEISIEGTDVTFQTPDEFGPLSQMLIDLKWPGKNAPKWVVGNERGTTTIAYDLKDNDISSASMEELIPAFSQVFDRMIPGIVWKERKVMSLGGQDWAYLEMTSNAIDTDIHNMMLVTSYEKKMLVFNFNSTKEEIQQYKPALEESINSIKMGNVGQ